MVPGSIHVKDIFNFSTTMLERFAERQHGGRGMGFVAVGSFCFSRYGKNKQIKLKKFTGIKECLEGITYHEK